MQIVHDFDHTGFNNDYLVKTHSALALQYNDISPLENHHIASAFQLLHVPDFNFIGHFPKDVTTSFRKLVIDMVLETDMKKHFEIVDRFNVRCLHMDQKSPLPQWQQAQMLLV